MDIPIKYSVDKGVPIPVSRTEAAVPLSKMEVGESIVFPLSKRSGVQTHASITKRRNGKEFTVRKVNDTEARVWRTK